jgi:hypothetical protein
MRLLRKLKAYLRKNSEIIKVGIGVVKTLVIIRINIAKSKLKIQDLLSNKGTSTPSHLAISLSTMMMSFTLPTVCHILTLILLIISARFNRNKWTM